ncbi:MAG TPA: phosphatase PAP2 family protein [Terracidiphilus sp.]|jgi:undecaprenyl-diphosphatase|nr:phosphatase PAP2 family protein [Terracidiphilus sp.]
MVNPFDTGILQFLNQFAQRSWLFDKTVVFLSVDPLIGGAISTAFLWWAWFRPSKEKAAERETVIAGLVFSFVALFVARGLALMLPFRVRPYMAPELHFRHPYDTLMYYEDLIHWSSFPSDHAVLYFSLATCVFVISWKAGLLCYSHAFFLVCMPRVYLGEHYPTDILAGAALGVGIGSLCSITSLRDWFGRPTLRLREYSPALFYTIFYLGTFSFATNFDAERKITYYAAQVIGGLVHHNL